MGRCAGPDRPTVNSNVRAEAILLARSIYLFVASALGGKCVSVLLETVTVSSLCPLFVSSMYQIRSPPLLTPPPDDVCYEERSSRFPRACSRPLSQCAIVSASFLFLIQAASAFLCAWTAPGIHKGSPDAIDEATSHILAEVTHLPPLLVEKSTLAQLFLSCVPALRAAPIAAPCGTPPP